MGLQTNFTKILGLRYPSGCRVGTCFSSMHWVFEGQDDGSSRFATSRQSCQTNAQNHKILQKSSRRPATFLLDHGESCRTFANTALHATAAPLQKHDELLQMGQGFSKRHRYLDQCSRLRLADVSKGNVLLSKGIHGPSCCYCSERSQQQRSEDNARIWERRKRVSFTKTIDLFYHTISSSRQRNDLNHPLQGSNLRPQC